MTTKRNGWTRSVVRTSSCSGRHFLLHLGLHTGIRCEVVETQRLNHAREDVARLSLTALQGIDGIVAVGGDGLFQEVLNGVLAIRSASTAPMDHHKKFDGRTCGRCLKCCLIHGNGLSQLTREHLFVACAWDRPSRRYMFGPYIHLQVDSSASKPACWGEVHDLRCSF